MVSTEPRIKDEPADILSVGAPLPDKSQIVVSKEEKFESSENCSVVSPVANDKVSTYAELL